MTRKALGQHFLANPTILRCVVDALSLQSGDTVIEIGPGRGALTRALVESYKEVDRFQITAIEKDVALASRLRQEFQSKIEIVEGDALKILPELLLKNSQLTTYNYKLVGNIPYYITGKLLRVIGELEHRPEIVVLMIQKEVAERVVAQAPRFNLLAASVRAWADVEVLFSVSRREFRPAPKVDSAVIKLKVVSCKLTEKQTDEYYKLVKILFKQPRKTILNNLSEGLKRSKKECLPLLSHIGLDERARPQVLSVRLITKLLQIL